MFLNKPLLWGSHPLSEGPAATLQSCLVDLAECRFCKFVNDADAITVDCGVFAGTSAAACL